MSEDLTKLNRDDLNKVAVERGIADAADESKYNTKGDLIKALENQPEQSNEDDQQDRAQEQDLSVPQAAPPAIDSPDDVDDQSGVEDVPSNEPDDEPEDEDEEPAAPRAVRGAPQDEEGMGFPRKNGKTVSIFSNKPHEVVRNVGGVMVPMTREEALGDSTKGIEAKTDAEVISKLKKMGKL